MGQRRTGEEDPLAALTAALGRRPPEALATLAPGVLDDLVAAVGDARDAQARELTAALDRALKVAPRPVRGLLRKVLLG